MKLASGPDALKFALAGNARLTLVSERTGTRFTFRIKAKTVKGGEAPMAPWFVSLLNGRENETDYTFLGTIFDDKVTYRHGRKSTVTPDAPSAKGFAWAWSFIAKAELPPGCEVWHEGRCGRCGRALTVPESIAMGIGPECAEMGF